MAIAGTQPAHAADAGTLDVRVRDISGSAMLFIIADMAEISLVAGSELPMQRVSIDERSMDPQAWIERFAAQRNLATRIRNGVVLIASECRLARAAVAPGLDDPDDSVNLFYQNARVSTPVAEAFAKLLSGERVEFPDADTNASVTVALRDVPTADAIAAVATVTGWEVTRGEGRLAFTHAGPDCGVAVAEGRPQPPPPDKNRSCSGSAVRHRCETLELYGIERLRVLGQISRAGGPKFALVESPEGVVYRITKGHYLGFDYGLVKRIDDEGVMINELVYDQGARRWTERPRLLPFVR
jgi:hypothetical protein